jgi:CelD/BcsL family acetyltransferase involved in cellulose biosynthesis
MTNELLSVELLPLASVATLESDWLDLEARSEGSFFLSWMWVQTWLSTYKPDCYVVTVRDLSQADNQQIVGLALLTRKTFKQTNRFTSSRLYMNQTGDKKFDQIWPEYSGMLTTQQHAATVLSVSLDYMQKNLEGWDELIVGIIREKHATMLEQASSLVRQDLWQAPSFGIDLTKINAKGADFVATLSKNTRSQIRRSFKLYQQSSGEVTLKPAENLEDALVLFNRIAPIHIARWGEAKGQSGFVNPHFVGFHEALITKAWPLGCIDVIEIKSGEKVLGYFYNFLYRGVVYFYLSGLVSENNAKLKPGLSAHSLSIMHYAQKGFHYYDFMGGDARYKRSLGAQADELFQISLQRKRVKFKIEHVLRKIKHSLGI